MYVRFRHFSMYLWGPGLWLQHDPIRIFCSEETVHLGTNHAQWMRVKLAILILDEPM